MIKAFKLSTFSPGFFDKIVGNNNKNTEQLDQSTIRGANRQQLKTFKKTLLAQKKKLAKALVNSQGSYYHFAKNKVAYVKALQLLATLYQRQAQINPKTKITSLQWAGFYTFAHTLIAQGPKQACEKISQLNLKATQKRQLRKKAQKYHQAVKPLLYPSAPSILPSTNPALFKELRLARPASPKPKTTTVSNAKKKNSNKQTPSPKLLKKNELSEITLLRNDLEYLIKYLEANSQIEQKFFDDNISSLSKRLIAFAEENLYLNLEPLEKWQKKFNLKKALAQFKDKTSYKKILNSLLEKVKIVHARKKRRALLTWRQQQRASDNDALYYLEKEDNGKFSVHEKYSERSNYANNLARIYDYYMQYIKSNKWKKSSNKQEIIDLLNAVLKEAAQQTNSATGKQNEQQPVKDDYSAIVAFHKKHNLSGEVRTGTIPADAFAKRIKAISATESEEIREQLKKNGILTVAYTLAPGKLSKNKVKSVLAPKYQQFADSIYYTLFRSSKKIVPCSIFPAVIEKLIFPLLTKPASIGKITPSIIQDAGLTYPIAVTADSPPDDSKYGKFLAYLSTVPKGKVPEEIHRFLLNETHYGNEVFETLNGPYVFVEKGFGDCDDYSLLAADALMRAGYEVSMISVYYKDTGHAITAFFKDGYWHYIDPSGLNRVYAKDLKELLQRQVLNSQYGTIQRARFHKLSFKNGKIFLGRVGFISSVNNKATEFRGRFPPGWDDKPLEKTAVQDKKLIIPPSQVAHKPNPPLSKATTKPTPAPQPKAPESSLTAFNTGFTTGLLYALSATNPLFAIAAFASW
jgi:hypothetical protein